MAFEACICTNSQSFNQQRLFIIVYFNLPDLRLHRLACPVR